MMLTDAPVIKLSELEHALLTHIPTTRDDSTQILLTLSQEEFLAWSSASPVGVIFALDVVVRHMRENYAMLSAKDKFTISRFLWKGNNALKFMALEIEQCIRSLE